MVKWEMSDGEIGRSYRLAKDPVMMVEILAGLNDVSVRTMRHKLRQLGLSVAEPDRTARCGSCWSREEDARLAALMDAGCSPASVAAQMPGRSAKGVYNRWRRLQVDYLQQRRSCEKRVAVCSSSAAQPDADAADRKAAHGKQGCGWSA